ncbi:MAG: phosphate acyltransferase PlsX [Ruminococcaceae bacterium]|nr:phosphate acyltransferase PlsX [Oscillospiraceae bacterium]
MKTIIVDMMGGDNAPLETVKGVGRAIEELDKDVKYILVGDQVQIETIARENEISLEGCEIVHTEEVITMTDDPILVVRGKENSSMSIGLRMLKEGKGDAFVSTGNTGALFTGANLIVRKVKGVKRPAIASLLPLQPPVLLADSGANVVVTPEYLEQFAIMGSAYMKNVMGVEDPRVGLLNNGEEEHKGTELQIETYKILKANESINFVGNVEGNRVMQDTCDVIVADGFTGNIFLKTMEGLGKMMLKTLKSTLYSKVRTRAAGLLIKKEMAGIKKTFDAGELGGAPILGISKPVIKAHGSSKAKAFKNAIRQAIAYSDTMLTTEIEEALAEVAARKKAAEEVQASEENK